MTFTLEFSVKSRVDIKKAFLWYEDKRPGLGDEFMFSLESVFTLLQRNPFTFQKRIESVRFALLRRFPYLIAFTINEDNHRVGILAVVHTHRGPEIISKRMSQ